MNISIRKAVSWIAYNDEPTLTEVYEIESLISVLLVADMFDKTAKDIAERVIAYRNSPSMNWKLAK